MPDDWKQLTISDIYRLIVALAQREIDLATVRAIIAQVPAPRMPHGRINIESIERLLNQTNGSTFIPEELARLINQPEGQPLAIQPAGFTIDCNAQPKVPAGWQLGRHNMALGLWAWNPQKTSLTDIDSFDCECTEHAAIEQYCVSYGAIPANAKVLDFLLEHPDLIPLEWRGKQVYFCGTVYENDDAKRVRGLVWNSYNGWRETFRQDEYGDWDEDYQDNDDNNDNTDDGEFVALIFL